VLEFDEFLRIEGCKKKDRHLFVGSGVVKNEKIVDVVRYAASRITPCIQVTHYLAGTTFTKQLPEFMLQYT
jgi:hypothetical protein